MQIGRNDQPMKLAIYRDAIVEASTWTTAIFALLLLLLSHLGRNSITEKSKNQKIQKKKKQKKKIQKSNPKPPWKKMAFHCGRESTGSSPLQLNSSVHVDRPLGSDAKSQLNFIQPLEI